MINIQIDEATIVAEATKVSADYIQREASGACFEIAYDKMTELFRNYDYTNLIERTMRKFVEERVEYDVHEYLFEKTLLSHGREITLQSLIDDYVREAVKEKLRKRVYDEVSKYITKRSKEIVEECLKEVKGNMIGKED